MSTINYQHFTLGVEEEYMVLDPHTRELKSHEQKIVQLGQAVLKDKVKAEMHQAVVEVGTDVCKNVDEALMDVASLRGNIAQIAGDLGLWVGASGTHPFSHWEKQLITDHFRYNQIVDELQEAARSNLIFGLHGKPANGHSYCEYSPIFSTPRICTKYQLAVLGIQRYRV
jgi:carboxylate-amine ligase